MRRLSSLGSKHLAHRKGRSVLTALGITLGVAILFGVQVSNATTKTGIESLIADFTGNADVIVTPAGAFDATMPASVNAKLRALPGVKASVGSFGFGTVLRTEDMVEEEPIEITIRGTDLREAEQIQPFTLVRGREYRRGAQEVIIPERLADMLVVDAGDTLDVPTRFGARRMTIVGILTNTGAGRTAQGEIAFTSIETTRAIDDRPNALSTVRIVLDERVENAEWIADHEKAFGEGYTFQNAATLAEGFRDFIDIFGLVLSFFATITLFVGSFLIYLTLSMAVIERVRSYGTMRALGATRRQIRRVVVAEAVTLGLVSTVLGLALGLAIARGLLVMITNLFEIEMPGLTITLQSIIVAVVIGMLITVFASLIPARRAARLSPVVAMKGDYASETRLSRAWIAGLVLTGGGVALGLATGAPVSLGSTPFILLGSILLVPVLLRPLARVLGRLTTRIASGAGDVAVLHLVKERSRSAYTLGLIMVVMAMIFSIGGLFASMSSALDRTLDRQFGADIQISASDTLGEQFEADLQRIEGVEEYTTFRYAESRFRDLQEAGEDPEDESAFALIRVIEPDNYFEVEGFQWADGSDGAARQALTKGGAVLLPEETRLRIDKELQEKGRRLGGSITLKTARGDKRFRIAGTYASFAGPPEAIVGIRDGMALFNVDDPSSFHVNLREGADPEAVSERIERDLTTRYNARVQTSATLKEEASEEFNQFFNIIYAILMVAAIVGLLGLGNTLAMSVLQRYREIGILRAVGTTRSQVRRMVLVESATLALVAFALALPLGLGLSVLTVRGISDTFGFVVPYVYPAGWVPLLALFGAVIAVLAALMPGRRAARLQIVDALQFE